jgi:hypothetical protein
LKNLFYLVFLLLFIIPIPLLNHETLEIKKKNLQENYLEIKESLNNLAKVSSVSQSPDQSNREKISAITESEEPLRTNIYSDGNFEEGDSYNRPVNFGSYSSGYSQRNFSYTDETHTGSYAGYIEGQGTPTTSWNPSTSRYLSGLQIYLEDDISVDFWIKIIANPLNSGSYIYFRNRFYNNTYYNLYYYLSFSQSDSPNPGWNSTNTKYLSLNQSLSTWINITRNVSADFENTFGAITPGLYLRDWYLYLSSPINASSPVKVIFDDVSVQNQTNYEFITNGDFELGNSGAWNEYSESPGTVSLTSEDKTEGNFAVNMTVTAVSAQSNGYSGLSGPWLSYPQGYYANEQNSLVLEFDWQYSDTFNGGNNQQSQIYVYFRNDTHWYYFYWYLGQTNDVNTNINSTGGTNQYYYFNATGFGNRNSWEHFRVDFSSLLSSLNASDLVMSYYEIYTNLGEEANSSVTLLVDNLKLLTFPTADPGFEIITGWNVNNPVPGWRLNTGNVNYVNLTTTAYQGNYGLNLTGSDTISAGVYRDTFLEITPGIYTDFWWQLNQIGESSYANIELEFDGGYSIYYILSSHSISFSNSTFSGYFLVSQFNTSGSWNNITRNILVDLNSLFSISDYQWNLTRVYIYSYAGSGARNTIFFDNMHFIEDTHGPDINSVTWTPSPTYYAPVIVRITASDELSGIATIQLVYQNDSIWYSVETILNSGYYEATIPIFPYNTSIQFYINASDKNSNIFIDNNLGSFYSYVVIDDISPFLFIKSPVNDSTVSDAIPFSVEASDEGSSIAYVNFYDGINFIGNDSSSPFIISWNTRQVGNGSHEISAVAYDQAGNIAFVNSSVNIQNDNASPIISFSQVTPSTPYNQEAVQISVGVFDSSLIRNVTLYYKIGSVWQSIVMSSSGALYYAEIPGAEWNTQVYYYIVANDIYDQESMLGSEISPLSYFVASKEPVPKLSSLFLYPDQPQYDQPVQVTVGLTNSTEITNFNLNYQIGDVDYQSIQMTRSGALYMGTIPATDWNTEVNYFIDVTDINDQVTTLGNLTHPLSYIVGDDIDPIMNVNGPPSDFPLFGIFDFQITGSDEGSDIFEIEVFINEESFFTATSSPATFTWDTTKVENGNFSLTFRITDNAGNSYEITNNYDVNNAEGLDEISEEFNDFMQNNGFTVGAGTLIGLFTVFKFIMWRRHKS